MKKIISALIIVVLIAVLAVSLSACNNATTQGQLANILNEHSEEHFVYDVINSQDNSNGTYTVDIVSYSKGDTIANFGNTTLQNVQDGILVASKLEIDNVVYNTGCYYNLINGSSYMVPAYSFRTQKENGSETFALQANYADGSFNYEKVFDGDASTKQSGSIEVSGTYFDNNQFLQSLRSVTTFSSAFTFSFATPLADEIESSLVTLNTTCVAVQKVVDIAYTNASSDEKIKLEGIDCYKMRLSRSTEVVGTAQTLYYATSNISVNGWEVKTPLIKYVAPYKNDAGEKFEMVYTLKTVSIA